jgi:hypothetical protein
LHLISLLESCHQVIASADLRKNTARWSLSKLLCQLRLLELFLVVVFVKLNKRLISLELIQVLDIL